eukprot:4398437-Lingulodinium_polyedra.AAC.1
MGPAHQEPRGGPPAAVPWIPPAPGDEAGRRPSGPGGACPGPRDAAAVSEQHGAPPGGGAGYARPP